VTWLAEQLQAKDFTVSVIHGEMAQNDRQRVLNEFKQGLSRILLTTDLISRGIDVHGVCSRIIRYLFLYSVSITFGSFLEVF
jgi:translation initiation factor 4A